MVSLIVATIVQALLKLKIYYTEILSSRTAHTQHRDRSCISVCLCWSGSWTAGMAPVLSVSIHLE